MGERSGKTIVHCHGVFDLLHVGHIKFLEDSRNLGDVLIVALEMILMEKIRKYPLARMINVSFVLLGIGLGLMPLGRGYAFGALTVAIWTFGEMLSMPLVTALIAGRADDSNRGRYMGLFSFVFSLAFIVAPAGGTAIYDRFGGDAVWFVCAALCVLIAAAFSALRPYLQEGVKPTFYPKTGKR